MLFIYTYKYFTFISKAIISNFEWKHINWTLFLLLAKLSWLFYQQEIEEENKKISIIIANKRQYCCCCFYFFTIPKNQILINSYLRLFRRISYKFIESSNSKQENFLFFFYTNIMQFLLHKATTRAKEINFENRKIYIISHSTNNLKSHNCVRWKTLKEK